MIDKDLREYMELRKTLCGHEGARGSGSKSLDSQEGVRPTGQGAPGDQKDDG